jgi:hypothetical protein
LLVYSLQLNSWVKINPCPPELKSLLICVSAAAAVWKPARQRLSNLSKADFAVPYCNQMKQKNEKSVKRRENKKPDNRLKMKEQNEGYALIPERNQNIQK